MSSTRRKLIALLQEHNDHYISGQALSEQLDISRSAIWKHMNELKKDGYIIEAKAKLGYRIISFPKKLSENTISWGLETEWLGKTVIHKETTTSTQRIAHELALDGAAHGTVIVADEQTQSKGRVERVWQSKKEQGIWMSMILRPNIPPYLAPQLTLLTATVLAEVLDKYGVKPQIKWPNDILINGKKISGILTEMQAEQDSILYVIIGTGININHLREDFTDEVKEKATSLTIETKKSWDLAPIIQDILVTFEKKYGHYMEHGFEGVKTDWESYGFRINERLQVDTPKESWEGLFLGIAEDGALLLKRDDDRIERIYSAEIAWF